MLKRLYRCLNCGAIEEFLEGWGIVAHQCSECNSPMQVLFQSPKIVMDPQKE